MGCRLWGHTESDMTEVTPMGRRRGWRESTLPRSTACTRDLWQTPRPREENLRSCVSEKMGRTLHACFQTESGESPGRFTEEVRSRKSLGQTQRGEESPGAVFLGPLSLTLTQGSIPVNSGFSFLAPGGCAPISQESKWRFVSQWHMTLDVIYKSVIKGLFGYLKTPSAYLS